MRASRPRINVPLPTPEGPVMTNTRATRAAPLGLSPKERDELGALPGRAPADRLARRDAALRDALAGLHAPVLRHREQQVEDLRRLDVARRLHQEVVDGDAAGLEVALELSALRADLVGACQRDHPLVQGTLGSSCVLGGRFTGGRRHGRRVYNVKTPHQAPTAEFASTSS